MALQVTDASFESEVLQSDKLTVVDFWAEWCGPCKMMNPVLDELSKELEGRVVIAKLNVDENPEIPTNLMIRGIPTFVMFKGGKEVGRIVGAQSKQAMLSKIEALV
ncbi:MAG: thioredoxin [Chitinophagales bacterium]